MRENAAFRWSERAFPTPIGYSDSNVAGERGSYFYIGRLDSVACLDTIGVRFAESPKYGP